MSANWLDAIPEQLRDKAQTAAAEAFGATPISSTQPVLGGASGALTYKIDVHDRPYLLRMETRRSPIRNPHQYVCMKIAADAGIAPPVRYADDAAGVVILDFVTQRPLAECPGGPVGFAVAVGKLAADLQAVEPFPVLGDFRVFLQRMLVYIRTGFAPNILDPHAEVFERIRDAYSWSPETHVSSHNEPNPGNILFDGTRLWLIDWETAYRNDPLTDIAILTQNHAPTRELEDALLTAWLGGPPDRLLRARLVLMRQLTRLYYAGIILAPSVASSIAASALVTDLSAPTPDEFRAQIASDQLKPTSSETKMLLGKMFLAGFLATSRVAEFEEALSIARSG
jgi:Ser/Thr protein kinase RdoA (MazF antagonist)